MTKQPKEYSIEDWLKALRSGKYKQAEGCLRSDEEDGKHFCCLGVLEYTTNGLPKSTLTVETEGPPYLTKEESKYKTHVNKVYKNIQEFLESNGLGSNDLITMNDEGDSFSEIADYIERKLKALDKRDREDKTDDS